MKISWFGFGIVLALFGGGCGGRRAEAGADTATASATASGLSGSNGDTPALGRPAPLGDSSVLGHPAPLGDTPALGRPAPLGDSAALTRGRIADETGAPADWALLPFAKPDSVNPVLTPGPGYFTDPILHRQIRWEEKDVFNPAVAVKDGVLYLLYRAQDRIGQPAGTSRIGLAASTDGFRFTRSPSPVLYPDDDAQKRVEWEGGCEDPRVVEDEKRTYYMTYTAYDGNLGRLMIATSTDLRHWTKHGSVFARAWGGKYKDLWSKSGSIVSRYEQGRIIATRVAGKYWMYWGDQNIWAATSDDLINWTPVEMAAGEQPPIPLRGQAKNMPRLKIVVPTRTKNFDSDLVESGPPAMLTDKGILLIYNGRNSRRAGDSSLPEGMYSGGQVLMDRDDPTRVIHRLAHHFIRPDRSYEITGQVGQVCFLEALARYKGKWLLYYGTADSKIAVAAAAAVAAK